LLPKNSIYFLGFFSILIISSFQFSYGDTGTIPIDSFNVDYNLENGVLDTIFLDPDFIDSSS